jgi:hypothetical protein
MPQNVIVVGSKQAKVDENGPLFLCTTLDLQQFWTREAIRCGMIAQVTPRKKGTKYTDRDGKEQEVKKDGLNFDFIVGTAADIANLTTAKAALAQLASI